MLFYPYISGTRLSLKVAGGLEPIPPDIGQDCVREMLIQLCGLDHVDNNASQYTTNTTD